MSVVITRLNSDMQFLCDKYCMKTGEDSAGLKSSPHFRRIYMVWGIKHLLKWWGTENLSALDDFSNYRTIVLVEAKCCHWHFFRRAFFDYGEWFPFTSHIFPLKKRVTALLSVTLFKLRLFIGKNTYFLERHIDRKRTDFQTNYLIDEGYEEAQVFS